MWNRGVTWWGVIVACVGVRAAIPLAALAAEGTALPDLPRYDYGPFSGDANGYYAAAREAVSTGRTKAPALFAGLVLVTALLVVLKRHGAPSWVLLFCAGAGIAAAVTIVVGSMRPSGTPVIGWSLLWSIPLAPLRALGSDVNRDAAFAAGLAVSLLANAVTIVATAYVGLLASGRRSVGLVAATAWALWPFVPGLIVGSRGWSNGSWNVDVGLGLYTEPVSTALVMVAIALLIAGPVSDLTAVAAGLSLGYATIVKYSNGGLAAALVLVLVLASRRRSALLAAAAGLLFLPAIVLYWNTGYGLYYSGGISVNPHPVALRYATHAWSDSILFTPVMVGILVAPAIVGIVLLTSNYARAILAAPIVATVATYTFYDVTPIHPRFLYVTLPQVLVLASVALVTLCSKVLANVGFHRRIAARKP